MYTSMLSGITISCRNYFLTYGHAPRGRGCWAFFMGDPDDMANAFWTKHSTFAESRREAVAEAKRRGVDFIHVGT